MYSGLLKVQFPGRISIYYFMNNIHLEEDICLPCLFQILYEMFKLIIALNTEVIMQKIYIKSTESSSYKSLEILNYFFFFLEILNFLIPRILLGNGLSNLRSSYIADKIPRFY